ncbi:MAG: hypothetical protein R6W75_11590 [Smithellaceae bacterium]
MPAAAGAGQVSAATPPDKPEIYPEGCKTCAARRYVDQSSDSSVSFQTPTKLSAGEAALAVAAHENEHVVHNQERAEQENMKAHSTVTISYGVCPECGRIYVAGGKTETHFTPKQQIDDIHRGNNVNTFA